MQKIMVLFLTFLLVLTACGTNDDNDGNTGLEGVEQKPTATEQIEVTPTTDIEADTIANATTNSSETQPAGYLAYIQNDILTVFDFATQTTQEVAQGVLPDYIYSSPDQTTVYYAVHDTTEDKVFFYGYTFADGSRRQIAEAQPSISANGSLWFLYLWSPDAEWGILLTSQMGIRPLLVNTQQAVAPIPLSNTSLSTPLWTMDNQLITIVQENSLPPIDVPVHEYFAPIEEIQVIHTPDGEVTDITNQFALDSISSYTELRGLLEEAGYDLSYLPTNPRPIIWTPAGRQEQENRSEYCWEYQIAQDDEVRYTAEDVYTLGNLENLANGSSVFMQIEFADCSFLSGPTGKLVRLTADDTAIVLTDTLTSMGDRNTARPFFMQGRYDIAPNQDYAVFVATEEAGENIALTIVDMNGGEPMPVLVDDEPVENVFGVVWGQ